MIARATDSETQAANTTQEALKSRELKDFAAQLPEVKAQLDKIAEAAKSQLKNANAAAAAEKKALDELQSALEKFPF